MITRRKNEQTFLVGVFFILKNALTKPNVKKLIDFRGFI